MTEHELAIYSHLKQSRYLVDLPDDSLREFLALIEYETYDRGETVIVQGEQNHDVFFVIDGNVLVKADNQPLYSLGRKGDIFGEMSVVSGQPSKISVEVLRDLQVLSISSRSLESIQKDTTHKLSQVFYTWLARILADKLHLTTEKAKRFEDISTELHESLVIQKQTTQNLKRLTAELEKSKVELEELNQLKNEFIGIASHDLRSPISSVIAVMETIPECYDLDASVTKVLKSVRETCHEQLTLVNDLLDVAKIESGKIDLDCKTLSLEQLLLFLQQIRNRNRMLANSKRIDLQFDDRLTTGEHPIDFSAPLISLDLPKIQQVINNLLSNAIKFTAENGCIILRAELTRESAQVSVQDNGVGISQQERSLVFDKFHQVKGRRLGTRGEKGTGLGLAICKNLVELHGGRIWVESEVGRGSSFSLSLPRLEA